MLTQLRVQVFSDISNEQRPQVSLQLFPQSKNQQTFHCAVIIFVAVAISGATS